MKKMFITTLLLAVLNSAAAEENKFFFNIGIGAVDVDTDNARQQGPNASLAPIFGYEVDADEVFNLGFGYHLTEQFAVQLNLGYREFELGNEPLSANPLGSFAGNTYTVNGGVDSTSLLLNGIYKFNTNSKLTPYVKAGLGIALNDATVSQQIIPVFNLIGDTRLIGSSCAGTTFCFPDDDSIEFSWSVGAGVNYSLTDSISLGIDYQYIDLGDAVSGVDPNGDFIQFDSLTNNELSLNLIYSF